MTLVASKGSQTGRGIRELDGRVSWGGLVVGNWSPLGPRDASESPCCLPALRPRFSSPLRTHCLVTREGQHHLSCGERETQLSKAMMMMMLMMTVTFGVRCVKNSAFLHDNNPFHIQEHLCSVPGIKSS